MSRLWFLGVVIVIVSLCLVFEMIIGPEEQDPIFIVKQIENSCEGEVSYRVTADSEFTVDVKDYEQGGSFSVVFTSSEVMTELVVTEVSVFYTSSQRFELFFRPVKGEVHSFYIDPYTNENCFD